MSTQMRRYNRLVGSSRQSTLQRSSLKFGRDELWPLEGSGNAYRPTAHFFGAASCGGPGERGRRVDTADSRRATDEHGDGATSAARGCRASCVDLGPRSTLPGDVRFSTDCVRYSGTSRLQPQYVDPPLIAKRRHDAGRCAATPAVKSTESTAYGDGMIERRLERIASTPRLSLFRGSRIFLKRKVATVSDGGDGGAWPDTG